MLQKLLRALSEPSQFNLFSKLVRQLFPQYNPQPQAKSLSTAAQEQQMPFGISWCYQSVADGEDEICNSVLIGTPEEVPLLELEITNILSDKTITIVPSEDVTQADTNNYHFRLKFNIGLLADIKQIAVDTENWSIAAETDEGSDNLYLLWIGKKEITLSSGEATTILLEGLAVNSKQLAADYEVTATSGDIEVNISWLFQQIEVEAISIGSKLRLPPPQNDDYYDNLTLELEMVKATGKSNIPLFVGFVNCNKVFNTNDQSSSLKLRITNTNFPSTVDPSLASVDISTAGSRVAYGPPPGNPGPFPDPDAPIYPYPTPPVPKTSITFKYDPELNFSSELIVVLEVGTVTDVPWALGTKDEVNGISIEIDQWQQNGSVEQIKVGNIVKALQWTFVPDGQDVVLGAQETILINLINIVTNHPSGETNLYLFYKNVVGYQDGKFTCQIEKAPLVFGESSNSTRQVQIGDTAEIQNPGSLLFRSDTDETGDRSLVEFLKQDETAPLMALDSSGNLNVVDTLTARKILGDGAVFTGMILMWSGSVNDIPDGWELCNGSNLTPDLTDKFIVGAGGDYSVSETGGSDTVTLSTNEMPSHNHTIYDPGHIHSFSRREYELSSNSDDTRVGGSLLEDANTEKAITNIIIESTGEGLPHENRPPYYALCFIMKVDL
ncbi:MAG: hypothetical protein F6K14_16620 [Symploca sp. SIO2C1]|nr:hypothetical protein [Symploca sp. SIO2C1]